MTKRVLSIGSIVIVFLSLMACGNNDEVENPPENAMNDNQENQQAADQGTQTDNSQEGQPQTENEANNTNNGYGFVAFDLEADYEELDDALDVDYENDKDEEMEASYHFRSEGFDLKGDEAMEELDSIFSSFPFDENTSDEEVLSEVSEAFNIPEDAPNIELEIEFNNGTEKEYRK